MVQPRTSPIDASYRLTGGASDPGYCRRATMQALSGRVSEDLLGDVLLVVSELVANGVLHAPGALTFNVAMSDLRVTAAVEDGVPDGDLTWGDPGAGVARGRGLHIVDQLADRWGVEPVPGGKRVWAAFDVERAPPPGG